MAAPRVWPSRSSTSGCPRASQDRLAEVEKALTGHVRSRAGFVTEAASHLMEAGGKRFRPLLVLLAAETGDTPTSRT